MSRVYKHISRPEHSRPAREELGISPDEIIDVSMLRMLLHARGLTKKMNAVVGSLIAEEGLWEPALDLAMSDDAQTAFRASWALEWAYATNMDYFERFIPRFFEDYLSATNESVNRVYSKMVCDMMRRGALTLTDEQALAVAEKAFDLLVNPGTAVAVKVWQIELLSDLSGHIDWIEENLTEIVRAMSEKPDCTPAEAAHARHYFRELEKRTKRKENRGSRILTQ